MDSKGRGRKSLALIFVSWAATMVDAILCSNKFPIIDFLHKWKNLKAHLNPVVAVCRNFYKEICPNSSEKTVTNAIIRSLESPSGLFPPETRCSRLTALAVRTSQEFSSAEKRYLTLGRAPFLWEGYILWLLHADS